MGAILTDLAWCLLYHGALGLLSFFVGQALPLSWFRSGKQAFFRSHKWEKNGTVYRRLGVCHWKDSVIDMSRICGWMIPKSMKTRKSADELGDMIHETCVAELVHECLALLGFVAVLFRRSVWSLLFSIVYAVGNLPYIIIQRYNRPRLVRLRDKMLSRSPSR